MFFHRHHHYRRWLHCHRCSLVVVDFDVAVGGDDSDDTPHLHPAVLGHVMDYMFYGDVRTALLAGKRMAFEAVRLRRAGFPGCRLPDGLRMWSRSIFSALPYIVRVQVHGTARPVVSEDATTQIIPCL